MDRMTSHPMIVQHLGSVRSTALAVLAGVLLSACGGGGGGGGSQPPANVTISGQITFDRIPLDTVIGNGLNPAGVVQAPARQVTVQAIGSTGTALAEGTTDTAGNYALTVPANTNVFIRARAEMIKTGAAPTWNFTVRNNTTVGTNDALYAIDGNAATSGTANSTRNLNAPSGFGVNSYTGERAAAPFAILDTVFRAKELILTAAPSTEFPELRLFWSDDNRPVANRLCYDDGEIGTSSYVVRGPPPLDVDECGQLIAEGIYILGDFAAGAGDTDEFDQSVVAHEFGHYFEDRFARSDSIGGVHGNDIPLDLRVAFGEGWGNAFSGMALGGPVYRDSSQGVQADFALDMEADGQGAGFNEGWFSEVSVGEILWDLFDPANDAGDTAALGFPPLFAVMTGAQVNTDALTSIYSFATALRAANAGAAAAIDDLLEGENIVGTGDFGVGETNDGNPSANNGVLPVYQDIVRNDPAKLVCSLSPFGHGSSNKLGNRVFLRFNNDATRLVTITAQGAVNGGGSIAAEDPDIFVLRRGTLAALGANTGPTETVDQISLPAGLYIIEVFDFNIDETGSGLQPRCMTVSVTGN
jgi:hypothetical protein